MADFVSVRQQFADQLFPLLPASWAKHHYAPGEPVVKGPTVVLEQTTIRRAPVSPLGVDQTALVATVLSPILDPEKGEDALEAATLILLDAIDQIDSANRGDAARGVAYNYPSYAVELTLITPRKDI